MNVYILIYQDQVSSDPCTIMSVHRTELGATQAMEQAIAEYCDEDGDVDECFNVAVMELET